MWAHYSSQFKGLCIAYDLFSLLKFLPAEISFSKISYTEEVPNVHFSRSEYEYDKQAKMVLSYKNHRWLYEREWRMFAPAQGPIRYNDLSCVTEIYVGARIAHHHLQKIEKRMKPLRIPVRRMYLDGYKMTFHSSNELPINQPQLPI